MHKQRHIFITIFTFRILNRNEFITNWNIRLLYPETDQMVERNKAFRLKYYELINLKNII